MSEYLRSRPEVNPCEVVESEMLVLSIQSESDPGMIYDLFLKKTIEVDGRQTEVVGLKEDSQYFKLSEFQFGRRLATIMLDENGYMYTFNSELNGFEKNRRLISGSGRSLVKELFRNL